MGEGAEPDDRPDTSFGLADRGPCCCAAKETLPERVARDHRLARLTLLGPPTPELPSRSRGDVTQVCEFADEGGSERIQWQPRPQVSPSDCDHVARANTARVISGGMRWLAMSSGQFSTSADAQSAHRATSA